MCERDFKVAESQTAPGKNFKKFFPKCHSTLDNSNIVTLEVTWCGRGAGLRIRRLKGEWESKKEEVYA
jgi:hypothetical protein